MTTSRDVSQHYTIDGLGTRILDALSAAGKDVNALTVEDLAPIDAFHIRGRAATEELAGWIGLDATRRVLDVGSGIGGTSRYLAATFGCRCTGIDVTPTHCQVAEMLTARVGLSERVTFREASALEMPVPDASFDVAWTEHVQMNIGDKATFYGEIARVLEPGGHLVFHDIFAGTGGEVRFPVPWAEKPSNSHLATPDEVRAHLESAGFLIRRWEDRTDAATRFFREVESRRKTHGPPPVALHVLVGPRARERFSNMIPNLEESRICTVQAVCERRG